MTYLNCDPPPQQHANQYRDLPVFHVRGTDLDDQEV